MITRQLQIQRRKRKVRRSKTNVLPLYHTTDACHVSKHLKKAVCFLFFKIYLQVTTIYINTDLQW